MKCSEIKNLLAAYAHNEVSAVAKESIQAHLAGCTACREDLERLERVETRLSQALNDRAAALTPPVYAWERLQSRIEKPNPGITNVKLGTRKPVFTSVLSSASLVRRFAIALGVVLLLVLLAPPALTLAGRFAAWVGSYYSFSIPDGRAGIGGFEAFNPYYPAYLPDGFSSIGIGGATGPDWDLLELTFSRGDRFVTILQSKGLREGGLSSDGLPDGEAVQVLDEAAVYLPGFASSADALRRAYPNVSITTNFDYTHLDLLAWNSGEIRIELISNLPYEQALQIARSLALMEAGSPQSGP